MLQNVKAILENSLRSDCICFILQLLFAVSNAESSCMCVMPYSSLLYRIVTGNNTNNKSESDQEDNDDVNDNDWSYGAEKKGDVVMLLYFFNLFVVTLNIRLYQMKFTIT